jgi:hypothetical protein
MKPRNYFINRIQRNLIGPGADNFGLPDIEEILINMPLQTYYSAVLFPESEKPEKLGLADTIQAQITIDDDGKEEDDSPEAEYESEHNENNEHHKQLDAKENSEKIYTQANSYFPTNFGLTFCIHKSVNTISVQFSAGYYELVKELSDRKVKIDKDKFDALVNDVNCPFTENLGYSEDGFMFLTSEIIDAKSRIINFLKSTEYRHKEAIEKLELFAYKQSLFKRKQLIETIDIQLNKEIYEYDVFKIEENIIAKCYLKIIPKGDERFVKILLKNTSEKHPKTKFSNGNEVLNSKCLFQTEIRINGSSLKPYKNYIAQNDFDKEATIINFQYRNLHHYGIGHGCAVTWEQSENPTWINTTFLPEVKINGVSQDFRKGQEHLQEIAKVKNLSLWSNLTQSEICDQLENFANTYSVWIEEQKKEATKIPDFKQITDGIIEKQVYNHKRLLSNIQILRTNIKVFKCFQLANTAMYIQMIISRDDRFGKKEKFLSEIQELLKDNELKYNDLSFFKNYKAQEPAYRPFQLAFFLLNIESMINVEHEDRQKRVDLLWFPTGGGKTEAYLCVTAFTIFWRRMENRNNYEGVSVIMRYTLRLLTAQQFERASRLICAMEFLRQKQNELNISNLGNEQITIGMWVGAATSPNNFEEAHKKLSTANDSLQNALNNNSLSVAEERNVFQLSSCPFCGSKLINQNPTNNEYIHGFSSSNNSFKIKCVNQKCCFKSEIPLQVVDEALYNKPPTLLFATVDKFAQLSHREEGHIFFNSLSDGLPPDLIIQDELHLLNGPLGSIVGLFEFMVELLCTKGNHKPKIIASTATTRNTDEQIANLYGNREVNIFPPQGISYDDSYFSRTTNESKRKHIGFMPTGKTGMDSQVRALLPALLFARLELYKNDKANYGDYWTIVSYYNSLKDVGKIYNKVGDEVIGDLRKQHRKWSYDTPFFEFNHQNLVSRTTELTSRIDSSKIKSTLKGLEISPNVEKKISEKGNEYWKINNVADLVLASNMFSVGIDIERLNIMLMNGQSKNIAEYIQASSRVARKHEGLVINLLDANRAREKSYFEHYVPFHQAYYKYVEPLTVTPFTATTFEKVLNTILVCYVRHIGNLNRNNQAHDFIGNVQDLISKIQVRIPDNEQVMKSEAEEIIKRFAEDWSSKVATKTAINEKLMYKNDLIQKTEKQDDWSLMNSMREVDTSSLIKINIFNRNEKQEENGEEN